MVTWLLVMSALQWLEVIRGCIYYFKMLGVETVETVETPAPKFRLQLMVFCVFFCVFLILKDMLPRWLLKLASTPHHLII